MVDTTYSDPTNYFFVFSGNYSVEDDTSGLPASFGDPNSVIKFNLSSATFRENNFDLVDVGSDGLLADGSDYWSSPSFQFSGYTVSIFSEYPIFVESGTLYLIVPESASSTFLVDAAFGGIVTTNVYQSPEDAAFLCFGADTCIATPHGEVPVQALSIGDTIMTASGGTTAVKWVGVRTVSSRFHMAERLMLVRFVPGSLGADVPARNLTVTADHALLVDGMLINASALVNGDTIDWVPMAELEDSFTVYHIETEAHDVILANGAPAETFIDASTRRNFDNYAEYAALYGVERVIPALPMPRISTARLVPNAIKDRLSGAQDVPHQRTA